MFYLNPAVKQLVDAEGLVPTEKQSEIETCIKAAEEMIQRMLGCTVVISGKKFIFSNLELYYVESVMKLMTGIAQPSNQSKEFPKLKSRHNSIKAFVSISVKMERADKTEWIWLLVSKV